MWLSPRPCSAVLGTDLFTWGTAPFADGAVLRGLWVAGLFHPLLCSFCGFTALFPKGTALLQLLFACLFQGFFSNFQLLTDNVSYSLGNAGKKKEKIRLVLGRSSTSSSASLLVWPALDPARRHLGRSGGWALFSAPLFHTHDTAGCFLSGRIGPSSSSPPFRLALAWSPPPLISLSHYWPSSRREGSSSSSPPFRLALA